MQDCERISHRELGSYALELDFSLRIVAEERSRFGFEWFYEISLGNEWAEMGIADARAPHLR